MTTKLMLCLTCGHPAVTIIGWYACLNALCPDYDGREIKEAKRKITIHEAWSRAHK